MSAKRQTPRNQTLEFPAIKYFPVDPQSGLVMLLIPDESWLHRFRRWPRRDWLIPGGILDSSGRDVPILDLVNWPDIPFWMKPIDAIFGSFVGHYHVDFVFGEPTQLTLPDFKERLCHLIYLERRFYSEETDMGYRARQRRVRQAQNYKGVIEAMDC